MARKTAKTRRKALIAKHGGDIAWRQKSGRWGHEKGWEWVSIDRFNAQCFHARTVIRREFHGRRIRALSCGVCRWRVMLRGTRGRPAKLKARADVVIKVPKETRRQW
jgi:hypothetical protein